MLYVLIPVEHIDRCNHRAWIIFDRCIKKHFFPRATVAHPQSVKDDAIDCIRRPLQHRDRAHVQFQARTGSYRKTKLLFAQYHTILKTKLKFNISLITGYHTINIPFATDINTTYFKSVLIYNFQAFRNPKFPHWHFRSDIYIARAPARATKRRIKKY